MPLQPTRSILRRGSSVGLRSKICSRFISIRLRVTERLGVSLRKKEWKQRHV